MMFGIKFASDTPFLNCIDQNAQTKKDCHSRIEKKQKLLLQEIAKVKAYRYNCLHLLYFARGHTYASGSNHTYENEVHTYSVHTA